MGQIPLKMESGKWHYGGHLEEKNSNNLYAYLAGGVQGYFA